MVSEEPGATDEGVEENQPKKVKILGIGRGKKTGRSKEKKRTPGEIRIQKDIAELDGGDVATVTFPNIKNLTLFNVQVTSLLAYNICLSK